MSYEKTFSLIFADVAENHMGMQKIGNLSENGFNLDDLIVIKKKFQEKHCECKIINLHWLLNDEQIQESNPAYILVVKNAVNTLLNDEKGSHLLYQEQDKLEKDKKALMYGRVVNKNARHNLCFSDISQEPKYEEGKGRIYSFSDLPVLNKIREMLGVYIGEKGNMLQAEGNYYYDLKKCGVRFHGDSGRKKAVIIRLGSTFPLCYAWYHNKERISDLLHLNNLSHGDMYIMSEKATGFDFMDKTKYTLRHAVGYDNYINC